jgi:hypothetical protein
MSSRFIGVVTAATAGAGATAATAGASGVGATSSAFTAKLLNRLNAIKVDAKALLHFFARLSDFIDILLDIL